MHNENKNMECFGAVTIKIFCERHQISTQMFYKLLVSGKAPRTMKVGRKRLISLVAIKEWVQLAENNALVVMKGG